MDVLSDIPSERFPRHIAIIMDGNGRWAVRRGLERIRGHQQGAHTVRNIGGTTARWLFGYKARWPAKTLLM